MACLYSNAATSLNANVSLHYKHPLLHSSNVSSSCLPIRRHSHNSSYASTVMIRCSIINDKRRAENVAASRTSDPKYIRIFDTTLRDGEQAAGATMTSKQKFDIARQLAKLRVDVIEAGFPASSDADFELVKLVARELGSIVDEEGYVPIICGLARSTKKDVDRAWDALKYAKKPMIHVFIATSEIHMKYKLNMSREEVVEKATSIVAYARSLGCEDVRFSAEDSTRTDREFLYHIIGEVIKAGASSVGLPDTVGCNLPSEFAQLVADVKANTPGIENVIITVHCHNDLGLATANTLAGISEGARQVDLTINGIGERAGNASLEEVVMAIKCRGEQALDGLYTGINTQHIITTSKMVEEYSGLSVQPHKAIVGANAFAHESGIHQDGVLKHKDTYEIISPEDVGIYRANVNGIVLGRLSGRHALKAKMLEHGYEFDNKELEELFWRFKTMAESTKKFTDDDLKALVSDKLFQPEVPQVAWQLGDVQITRGSLGLYTATVKLIDTDGQEHVACSVGTGHVDAAYKAVNLILKVPVTLLDYSVNSVAGIDAIASSKVLIRGEDDSNSTFSGTGADGDIVISSVQAYVGALNKLLSYQKSKGSAVELDGVVQKQSKDFAY